MDFVSIPIITGDVTRLAGCCEKDAGVHEGKKEGNNQQGAGCRDVRRTGPEMH